jgi:hypothetical protein
MNKLSITVGLVMGLAIQYGLGRLLSGGTTSGEAREVRELAPVVAPVTARTTAARIPRQRSLVS